MLADLVLDNLTYNTSHLVSRDDRAVFESGMFPPPTVLDNTVLEGHMWCQLAAQVGKRTIKCQVVDEDPILEILRQFRTATPIGQARLLQRLYPLKIPVRPAAERLGVPKTKVATLKRLISVQPEIQEAYNKGEISDSKLAEIAKLTTRLGQLRAFWRLT